MKVSDRLFICSLIGFVLAYMREELYEYLRFPHSAFWPTVLIPARHMHNVISHGVHDIFRHALCGIAGRQCTVVPLTPVVFVQSPSHLAQRLCLVLTNKVYFTLVMFWHKTYLFRKWLATFGFHLPSPFSLWKTRHTTLSVQVLWTWRRRICASFPVAKRFLWCLDAILRPMTRCCSLTSCAWERAAAALCLCVHA